MVQKGILDLVINISSQPECKLTHQSQPGTMANSLAIVPAPLRNSIVETRQ
jgi:hypothetical protein